MKGSGALFLKNACSRWINSRCAKTGMESRRRDCCTWRSPGTRPTSGRMQRRPWPYSKPPRNYAKPSQPVAASMSWMAVILRAVAKHHYGPYGFLTEGVDWNDHVVQQHRIGQAKYAAIQY